MDALNLTHHFLIAMPSMADSYFSKSLIYLCEHSAQGAMGLIVNRPIDMTLTGLMEKVDIEIQTTTLLDHPIYFGGPVQTDRGFVLHQPQGNYQATLRITDDLGLTSSRDVLQSLAREGEPNQIIVTLGYSGWGAGQLEKEMRENAWLTVPADFKILFGTPHNERLTAAMDKLGVSYASLSEVAGHA